MTSPFLFLFSLPEGVVRTLRKTGANCSRSALITQDAG